MEIHLLILLFLLFIAMLVKWDDLILATRDIISIVNYFRAKKG
jgi:hypothetical protein